jgi:hypothetical protein
MLTVVEHSTVNEVQQSSRGEAVCVTGTIPSDGTARFGRLRHHAFKLFRRTLRSITRDGDGQKMQGREFRLPRFIGFSSGNLYTADAGTLGDCMLET